METEQFEGMLGVAETLAKAFEEYMAAKDAVASADAALQVANETASASAMKLHACTKAYEDAKVALIESIESL